MKMSNKEEEEGKTVSIRTPRLEPLDRLYVRAYLSSLSHIEAHRTVAPNLKQHHSDNPFSRKESVQFHISSALQDKADSLMISPELIIEKLWKEGTREGSGSNHAARIQALTQLGKHFGLFQEKREDNNQVFNIVNYNSPSLPQLDEKILIDPEEAQGTLEGIVITTYENDE
jgi:hypothetical protein